MTSRSFFRAATAALGLGGALTAAAQPLPTTVTFRNYFDDLTFNRPVKISPYPDARDAHVVVQQSGQLITVRREGGAWVRTDTASIPVLGGNTDRSEQGLLGFAFHPQFADNGKYYAYFITGSGNGVSLVVERTAGASRRPRTSDPQTTILRMAQPYSNHNGGSIGFGTDGMLYVAFGDGGSANDPENRAQDLGVFFGKILRLDVDGPDAFPQDTALNYSVPDDNPFVGEENRRGEIWAYGLRNPYRWNFHPVNGDLWVGDVGQNRYEEISRVRKGDNLGWRLREGAFCFNPSSGCPSEDLTPPAITMQRSHAASITGGAFFTGDPASAYHGVYVFGDYMTNHVWAARPSGGSLTDSTRIGAVNNVASFDRDAVGNVLAVSISATTAAVADNGVVYILESPDMRHDPAGIRQGRLLRDPSFRVADVRRNPDAFTVRTTDGRIATSRSTTGVFLVARCGDPASARLMMLAER